MKNYSVTHVKYNIFYSRFKLQIYKQYLMIIACQMCHEWKWDIILLFVSTASDKIVNCTAILRRIFRINFNVPVFWWLERFQPIFKAISKWRPDDVKNMTKSKQR